MSPQINSQPTPLLWTTATNGVVSADSLPMDDNQQIPIDDNEKAPID